MNREFTCINCPNGCKLFVTVEGEKIQVEGNQCKRGIDFAVNEINNPTRSLTTTVKTKFDYMPYLPVRTDGEIPKELTNNAIKELKKVVVRNEVKCGDIIVSSICDTGVNVIATLDI